MVLNLDAEAIWLPRPGRPIGLTHRWSDAVRERLPAPGSPRLAFPEAIESLPHCGIEPLTDSATFNESMTQ
jgi:hypothetical protein